MCESCYNIPFVEPCAQLALRLFAVCCAVLELQIILVSREREFPVLKHSTKYYKCMAVHSRCSAVLSSKQRFSASCCFFTFPKKLNILKRISSVGVLFDHIRLFRVLMQLEFNVAACCFYNRNVNI